MHEPEGEHVSLVGCIDCDGAGAYYYGPCLGDLDRAAAPCESCAGTGWAIEDIPELDLLDCEPWPPVDTDALLRQYGLGHE